MPKYRITAPDGKTFDVEGEGTAEEALAHIQATYQPQRATDQMAAAETLASLGSGAVATPIAGLAGIGAAGTRALGLTQAEPADVVRKVQDALTYEPRTQQGQNMTRMAAYPFEKLAQAGDFLGQKTADATGSPALGATVNTAVQAAPALLSRVKVRNGGSLGNPSRPVAAGEAETARSTPTQGGRPAGLERVPEKPPTVEELKSQAQAAYKRASDAGIVISDTGLKSLKTRIAADLAKDGLDKTLHPSATAALKRITDSKGQVSLDQIETLRKIANDARGSINPADARMAGKIVDHIDDFVENLREGDVVAGDAAAASALKEARSLYTRSKKAEEISTLIDRAGVSAQGFSGSGFENALRTEFRALAKNKNRMRRFNPEEQAAIRKVAMGGPLENTLRYIGKLAPTGSLSTMLNLGFTAATGGVGLAVPIAGTAGRIAATRMTMRNATAAEELMRRGSQPRNALKEEIPKRNALAE